MHDGVVEDWATFATVTGAAAASLTGLLFVAVSIRVDVIARSPSCATARADVAAVRHALFVSIALAIPDQAMGRGGSRGDRGAGDRSTRRRHAIGHVLDVVLPNGLTSVLLLISGVLVAAGVHAGLDVLVVPIVAALAGGVASAWLLLTRIDA